MARQTQPPEYCCEEVLWVSYPRGTLHQCSRKRAVTEGGKPYCKQHAPSAVNAREAKSRARRRAEASACKGLNTAALAAGKLQKLLGSGLGMARDPAGCRKMCRLDSPRVKNLLEDLYAPEPEAQGEQS
jgi:hypothetical protein